MSEKPEYTRSYGVAVGPASGAPVAVIFAVTRDDEFGIVKARYIDGDLVEESFLPGPWVA